MIKYIIGIILCVCICVYAFSDGIGKKSTKTPERFLFWVIVPPGYEYIRLRLGKVYSRSKMKEGYNLVIPGLYTVASRVDMKTQDIDLQPEEFWLEDQVEGLLKWFVRLRVTDSIKYSFNYDNPVEAVKNTALERAKNALTKVTSTDATTSLAIINKKFEESLPELNEIGKDFGVEIIAIRAKKIDFKPDYEASLERIRKAENEAKEIITHAQAFSDAQKAKLNPYVALAESMQEKGIDKEFYPIILQSLNVAAAVDKGVDTMIMPNGGNDFASTIVSAKKIIDKVDTE